MAWWGQVTGGTDDGAIEANPRAAFALLGLGLLVRHPHRQWVLWDNGLVLDTTLSLTFIVVLSLVGLSLDSLWNGLERMDMLKYYRT